MRILRVQNLLVRGDRLQKGWRTVLTSRCVNDWTYGRNDSYEKIIVVCGAGVGSDPATGIALAAAQQGVAFWRLR